MDEPQASPEPTRAVDIGLPLTPEDIADGIERRAEIYAQGDGEGVATVDGFAAKVVVQRGHLELHDGVGSDRRVRRYRKVDPPRRLVVGVGTVGILSFDALRWCSAVGTPVVVLGGDGSVLAASPPGRDDARLLRAQSLALFDPVGVEVARYLIGAKLQGQADVLTNEIGDGSFSESVLDLADHVEQDANTIEEVRQLEAAAANVYFAAWEQRVRVEFVRRDLLRIADHWMRFNGRRSSINPGSPRSAVDPAGACLNYSYRLAEVEAALACRRMGLSESVAILHADAAGRPSFACDLMEAIRPVVDAHVLRVLAGPLRKREFTEDDRGVVRCLAPITFRLAEAMPSYARHLDPVVARVTEMLASSSPYDVRVPSAALRQQHREAARTRAGQRGRSTGAGATRTNAAGEPKGQGPNPGGLPPRGRRRRAPASLSPPLPLATCRGCGGQLQVDDDRDRPRISWCPACLPARRTELGSGLAATSRRSAKAFVEGTGVLPSHTREASDRRSEGNARQRQAQLDFAAQGEDPVDKGWFLANVASRLTTCTLPAIAKATGASTSAASKWRAGRTAPHRRHWEALAALVGVIYPSECQKEGNTNG